MDNAITTQAENFCPHRSGKQFVIDHKELEVDTSNLAIVWASWKYLSPHTTMNTHNTNTSILHRPSRSINRVALSAAHSRVDRRKHATADPYPTVLSNLALRPLPIPNSDNLSAGPTADTINHGNTVSISASSRHSVSHLPRPVLRPRTQINIGAFNVRTLKQIGQQAALARKLDSLHIDVCCISETRIHDSSHRMKLTAPTLSTRYWLYTSGDSPAAVTGQAGVPFSADFTVPESNFLKNGLTPNLTHMGRSAVLRNCRCNYPNYLYQ
ncbi:uncharacterized protein DEA37_0001554 [Paragonimus westermani]|uniref:Endonuclease/exonuclease/phosphatase domain-containing protein n=1 Tax=Paragonimus westermani TaxID=34504 RepID=A0A5J4NRT2_9TREM|nr:uncharacterized protein DEA37_0001554 [Paragonimus westermani]